MQDDASHSEDSFGLTLGTDFSFEVSSDIDFDASYNIQMLDAASGGNSHHLKAITV